MAHDAERPTVEARVEQCRECGASDHRATYAEPTRARMLRESLCFTCLFWTEHLERRDRDDVARIAGRHYMIGGEAGSSGFRGFAGLHFVIAFFDGRVVSTTNLWTQGMIPAHFRERLPDNAAFTPSTVGRAQ